ncbi:MULTISPECIES: hypothetical protein [unclassified Marinobacter]|uniref:hypothetical protein n=1 Tax=unclassified Marinobacter TaxID=83889 RepID=UPI001268B33C|nr:MULTISPECIES: hypothetical protein [unclassified Marinobacter]
MKMRIAVGGTLGLTLSIGASIVDVHEIMRWGKLPQDKAGVSLLECLLLGAVEKQQSDSLASRI